MFKKALPGFVLIAIALWMWTQKDKDEPKQNFEKEVVETEEKPIVTPSSWNAQKPKKTTKPKKQEPKKAVEIKVPKRNVWPKLPSSEEVRFEVIDGYAVAFGDIILGKVKQGGGRFGYYRPQPPKGWDSYKIAYAIDSRVENKAAVREAIDYLKEKTVIELVPESGEQDVLVFTPFAENCASYLGRTGGRQPIFLSKDCQRDQVIHEILHALGFVHEQSRVDRDDYIEILYDNIDENYVNQFDISPGGLVNEYRGRAFHFDYNSIMMYRPTAFAAEEGLYTMRSKTHTPIPKNKQGLSDGDIERLHYLFGQFKEE